MATKINSVSAACFLADKEGETFTHKGVEYFVGSLVSHTARNGFEVSYVDENDDVKFVAMNTVTVYRAFVGA